MNNHHYSPHLKEYARELRLNSLSKAEKYIWKRVLSRRQTSFRFKRQRPIDKYIVDFFCSELCLIIEVDGSSHLTRGEYDQIRESRLKELGYIIVRFTEGEVLNEIDNVVKKLDHVIYCLLDNHPHP